MAYSINVYALDPFRIVTEGGKYSVDPGLVTIEVNNISVPVKVGHHLIKVAPKNGVTITCEGGQNEGDKKYKIDWGPGYRLYLTQDGDTLIILWDEDYFTRLWHAASQAERVACELVSCQRIVIPFHDCAVRGDLEYRKRLL